MAAAASEVLEVEDDSSGVRVDAAEVERLRFQVKMLDQVKTKRDSLQAIVNMNKAKLNKYAMEVDQLQTQLRTANEQLGSYSIPSPNCFGDHDKRDDRSGVVLSDTDKREDRSGVVLSNNDTREDRSDVVVTVPSLEKEALAQQVQHTLREALSAHMTLDSKSSDGTMTGSNSSPLAPLLLSTATEVKRVELGDVYSEYRALKAQLTRRRMSIYFNATEVCGIETIADMSDTEVSQLQTQLLSLQRAACSLQLERATSSAQLKPCVKIVESCPGVFKVRISVTAPTPRTHLIPPASSLQEQYWMCTAVFDRPCSLLRRPQLDCNVLLSRAHTHTRHSPVPQPFGSEMSLLAR